MAIVLVYQARPTSLDHRKLGAREVGLA